MTNKQKKIWAYCHALLQTISLKGFPPFDKVKWYIAITPKNRAIVLGSVRMPNAENSGETIDLVNSFILRAPLKIKAKRFAWEAYKLLEDLAIHEIGEHFLFLGNRTFNQHDNDKRYQDKKLDKHRARYEERMLLAEQQREEMKL